MRKFLATLFLIGSVSLVPAAAKADVWMLEILSLQPGVSAHHADDYLGALDIVARRHGGVRVSRYLASDVSSDEHVKVVGMWKFPSPEAMQALLTDPNYELISRLRERTFDEPTSSTFELVADRSHDTTATR